jgi:hypothetical protein
MIEVDHFMKNKWLAILLWGLLLIVLVAARLLNYISNDGISAWSAVGAAVIAVYAVIQEMEQSRFATGLDALMRQDEVWNGERMKQFRKSVVSSSMKNGRLSDDIDEVLDFFEFLGYLVYLRSIDENLVWNSYFYWLHRYRFLAKEYIAEKQQQDPTVWGDVISLHKKLVVIDKKARGCSEEGLVLSEDDMKKFKEEELAL